MPTTHPTDSWRKARAVAADHGRGEGWFAEWRSQRIAELTDPRREEMYWVSYRCTLLTDHPEIVRAISSVDPWRAGEVTFRTRGTGLPAPHAFASHPPRNGRLTVRGLHVDGDLSLIERAFVLLLRLGVVK